MTKIGTFIAVAFAAAMLWVAPAAANEVTRVADASPQVTLANGGISIEIGGRRHYDPYRDPYYDPYYDPYRDHRYGRCYDDWGYRVPCYPRRRPPVVVPFPIPIPVPAPHHPGHHRH